MKFLHNAEKLNLSYIMQDTSLESFLYIDANMILVQNVEHDLIWEEYLIKLTK